jgi:hypothetical protein
MALLLYCVMPIDTRRTAVNAPKRDPAQQPNTTHPFFPAPRPAAADVSTAARPVPFEARKDDEHAPEEPGYGHGV